MEEWTVRRFKGRPAYSAEIEGHSEKRKIISEDSYDSKKFKTSDVNEIDEKDGTDLRERSLRMNERILEATLTPRLVIVGIWTATVLYATYQMFLAAEEHLQWQKDPVMNPGPFTRLLGRGRDTTDFEWTVFTEVFFGKVIFWYGFYVVIGRATQVYVPRALPTVSAFVTFVFLKSLIGVLPTIYLFFMPVVYWILKRLQSRSVIWLATFGYLYLMESSWHKQLMAVTPGIPEYYFAISSAWNAARCISFCFDTWGRPDGTSVSSLISFIQYCFYFPLTINGPLILFDKYEEHILVRSSVPKGKDSLGNEAFTLVLKLGRALSWVVMIEITLHYLYFRPLALTIPALYDINWWALCGVVYWLGQFFQMKYVVMYGIPSAIAEFEGLPTPPLPKCIAYIHRYSVLWKDFDRGLYNFLVRYTYLPTLQFISRIDNKNQINVEFRKLLGSLASFIYVYIWHNGSYEVFIWSAFNFLGITIERIGSFLKQKIDTKYNVLPAVWDVFLEPIFTIPLAIMSVINSAVFCGTLPTAHTALLRFFSEFHIHYVPHFFFFFTHVGVLIRTWPKFRKEKLEKEQHYHTN